MNNEFSYNIDNIFNIFSSSLLENIIKKYNIDKYYELKQIHSDIVCIVDNNYLSNTLGDAMITNRKNIPLVIKTADCMPILIYDNVNKVMALVHSGWKGTIKGIAEKTINTMINKYNSKISNIMVYIYPSIKNCHFEVDSDVYDLFKDKMDNIDKYTIKKLNKYYINLQQIVKDNLNKLGIDKIFDSNICTYCYHDVFYSYRYNHTSNRNYLIAWIKE